MASSGRDKCGCKPCEEEKNLKASLQPVPGDNGKVTCPSCECTMHSDFISARQCMATAEHQNCTPPGCYLPIAEDGLNVLKQPVTVPTVSTGTEGGCSSATSLETKKEEMNKAALSNGPGSATEAAFRFSAEPTLEDIRKLQTAFTAERGWGKYHQPRNLLLALVGEVGELAELFQWREEVPEGLPGWTDPEREALSDELSDVLIYLVALANKCHVDLPSAALRKIEKNRLKYPAEQVYGSSKKYTEYQQ